MHNDEMTTDHFIPVVIDAVACGRHKVPLGVPCFHTPKPDGYGYYAGICNKRILKAGYNGKISPNSIRRFGNR